MNKFLIALVLTLCTVTTAVAQSAVFTSDEARKAFTDAIDLYLVPNSDLCTVGSYYVMPDGSSCYTRQVAAMYSPDGTAPDDYVPPMLRYFPRLEATFDSIFSLTQGRNPHALGAIVRGDDATTRVLRFSRPGAAPADTATYASNPYDNLQATASVENGSDYEQSIILKQKGNQIDIAHFYSTPPDSSFIVPGPMENLDSEFSYLVTARQAHVRKVSYGSDENVSGALHLRPRADANVEGVLVELTEMPSDTWENLYAKIRSNIGSRREISVYYAYDRPMWNRYSIEAYIIDHATRVIYAYHLDGNYGNRSMTGPFRAVRATYDTQPYLPENWWR